MKLEEFWKRDKEKIALTFEAKDNYRKVETLLDMLARGEIPEENVKHVAKEARRALQQYGSAVYKRDGKHPNKP